MKRVGIVIPEVRAGGVFQCTLSIIESLLEYAPSFRYLMLHYEGENPQQFLEAGSREAEFVPFSLRPVGSVRKAFHFLSLSLRWDRFTVPDVSEFLKDRVDLLVYPTPFTFVLPGRIPFVALIPDLMYRYYPQFPDYPLRLRISRDIVYGTYARNSLLNVVDSDQGIDDLEKFLHIPREKSRAIPFIPPGYIYRFKDMDLETARKILERHQLPESFLYYPANIWPHKNHRRLFQALRYLKEKKGLEIPLVLTGSRGGEYKKSFEELMLLAERSGISKHMFHLGFVSPEEAVALYKTSRALIFPTLIGPTSIPPIEAMVLGTPVLVSNLFEMPKQIGDAGLFFDPFNVEDMAQNIERVWGDDSLRQDLIRRGYERAKEFHPMRYAAHWERVINEAFQILSPLL